MDLSVLIPTRSRLDRLRDCLGGLAQQTLAGDRFEVLVGVDGPDEGETELAQTILPATRVCPGVHAGPAATRNRLIEVARGSVLLLLNDDVAPEPECLAVHLAAHDELVAAGRVALVLGASPWRVHQPDRLFDRLVRSTSMVFFYDRMTGPPAADAGHDWGFRHAWTLNLSVPTDAVRAVGGFDAALSCACYEDLEWAWRMRERFDAPVLYRPGAIVHHDHRYEPAGYLARERMLGREAYRLALAAPRCALDLFGRDLTDPDEAAYARAFVAREQKTAQRLRESFLALADIPADAIAGEYGDRLIAMLYEHHLLLKRSCWRHGLLEAVEHEALV